MMKDEHGRRVAIILKFQLGTVSDGVGYFAELVCDALRETYGHNAPTLEVIRTLDNGDRVLLQDRNGCVWHTGEAAHDTDPRVAQG